MALKSAMMDEMCVVIRRKGYSPNTAKTYRHWCEQFLLWLKAKNGRWVHPRGSGREGVEEWLTELAVVRNVSPTSQNVALQAVLFLFREVIRQPLAGVDALRARRPQRMPSVLSVPEVSALFAHLKGQNRLVAQLLYGAGLRIGEAVSLRLKDLDFDQRQIVVRAAKGAKDRVCQMPKRLIAELRRQVESATKFHRQDSAAGVCRVAVPYSFGRKCPAAESSLAWFWLFPSHKLSTCPESKRVGRHHVDESNFGRSLRVAAVRAKILKRVTPHCLRHSFATHSLNQGVDIRSLQKLMGHNDVRTTMIYTHVDAAGASSETSPLDRLPFTA